MIADQTPEGATPSRWRAARDRVPVAIGVIVTVLFLNNLAGASVRPLLPVYVERELGLSPAFSGLLLGVESLVGGMVSLAAGAVADAVGHRRVLIAGFAGFTFGLLQFTTHQPWLMVVLAVLYGMAHGLRSTAGQSYLLTAASAGSVGVATAAYFLGGTLGQAAGSAVAGPAIETWGFAPFALIAIGMNLVPLVIAARFLPTLPRAASAHRSLHPGEMLAIVRRRELLLLGGLRFFPTAFWGVWSLVIPLLLFRATESIVLTALYSTTGLVLSSISQFVVGRWSDRHGRKIPTLIFLGLQALAPVVAAGFTGYPAVLFGTGVVGMASGWTMSVLVLGAVRDRTQPHERGRAVGFIHTLWSLGLFVGSASAGLLLDLHASIPLAMAVGFSLVAIALAVALYRRAPTDMGLAVGQSLT